MKRETFVLSAILFLAGLPLGLKAQTFEFTYQGNLNSTGSPANGSYDFEFALFAVGGSQVGSTLTRTSVPVTDGVFTVSLNFGNNYTGADRELEIRVRPTGGGVFTTLAPRQLLRATPFSIVSVSAVSALNATTASNATQLGGVAASQYVLTGDTRLSDARNPLPNSTNYIQNSSSPQTSSNFNITGTGTANILSATTQFNIGSTRVLSFAGGTFVGVRAGNSNAGTSNSFFGRSAGDSNGSGSNNSFFGQNAGISNETGSQNSFFGASTGAANTTANNNSFFGFDAGRPTTTGSGNSFFGRAAGFSNVTGTKNTAIGDSADVGSGDLTFATAIGAGAVVSANNTVTLGRGVDTVQIPGSLSVVGSMSTAIINAATQYNIGGNRVLSIGGNLNTFVGVSSGSSNTGSLNAFFGNRAGESNTDGNFNSFFGGSAGQRNTSGGGNAFFGIVAGERNSTGSNNAFFGSDAGSENTTGGNNSFFGVSTGLSNTTGSNNSFFGGFADSSDGLTNATAVGSRALVTQSDALVLGSISAVNGATVDTRVGIGTTAPEMKLTVAGSGETFANGSAGFFLKNTIANMGIVQTVTNSGDWRLIVREPASATTRLSLSPEGRFLVDGTASISGNTGIGVAPNQPTERLDIRVNSGNIIFGGAGCPSGSVAVGMNGAFGNCVNYSVRGDGTNLLINRPTGGEVLFRENNGTTQVRIRAGGALAIAVLGSAGSTGLCRNASNEISTCSSSLRYKSNIQEFTPGLDLIKRLRPVSFDWISQGTRDIGLVAEEVADAEPLLATFNNLDEIEGVKYDRIGIVLVNAVKEQQTQMEAQHKEIGTLKETVKTLTAALCELNPQLSVCK